MDSLLQMYILYEKPVDYPDEYVVRIHRIINGKSEPVPDKELFAKCSTIKEAIGKIPRGLTFFQKSPVDPISIVGMWA